MGYKNREIEVKMVVMAGEKPYNHIAGINNVISKHFSKSRFKYIEGFSADTYWNKINNPHKIGFFRVREMEDGTCQLTVKEQDKGNNYDRVEIDVGSYDSPKQAILLMTQLLGPNLGVIKKKYYVHVLDSDHEEKPTVSVYQIKGDNRVFVEIEAHSSKEVERLRAEVAEVLQWSFGVYLEVETNSLFSIFIKGAKGVKKTRKVKKIG